MELDIVYLAIVIGVILVSMTFHEVMHGLVAYYLGDDTAKHEGRLTLNPIKHIDPFLTLVLPIMLAIFGLPIFGGAKPVPFNPLLVRGGEWGAALVAAAGPLTNLVLAFMGFAVLALSGIGAGTAGMVLTVFVTVNLGFFVFNMLPIPPLDGSRVIYALAPEFVRRGMELIERYGIMLVFLVVMLASPIIGSFMRQAINGIVQIFGMIFGIR
jgi:Zn-dependent protease